MATAPSHITIDGKVYFRTGSYNGEPKWRHYGTDGSGNVIEYAVLFYNGDWVIVNDQTLRNTPSTPISAVVIQTFTSGNFSDTTSSTFFTSTVSLGYSAIDVSGAGIAAVNGQYTRSTTNTNVFGKFYRFYEKGDYKIMPEGFISLSAKEFAWTINGANSPFKMADAYKNSTVLDIGQEPDASLRFPPTSNWVTVSGSRGGNPPTLTLRRAWNQPL